MTDERRFFLRDITRDHHHRLDSAIGAFHDRESYGRYLRGMAVFRAAVEVAMARTDWPSSFGDWRPGSIAEDLSLDLQDLGLHNATVPKLPPTEDLSELLGRLYVIEGSALGARLLVRRAGEIGLTKEFGARHLHRQVEDPAAWRRYLALLDAATPFDADNAGRAACHLFNLAHAAFAGVSDAQQ